MFQEQLPDRLVQKYAGNLTVPARKNDIQIDCLVPKLQCTLTRTTRCTCTARVQWVIMGQNCLFNCNDLLYILSFIPQFQSAVPIPADKPDFFQAFFSKCISCNCTCNGHLYIYFFIPSSSKEKFIIDNYIHHSMQYFVDFCCRPNINHSFVQPEPNGRKLRHFFSGRWLYLAMKPLCSTIKNSTIFPFWHEKTRGGWGGGVARDN